VIANDMALTSTARIRISNAIALADEIEKPQHLRQSSTVGYLISRDRSVKVFDKHEIAFQAVLLAEENGSLIRRNSEAQFGRFGNRSNGTKA
jgi:hypothetical protein